MAGTLGPGGLGSTVEASSHSLAGGVIGTLGDTVGSGGRVLDVRGYQPAEGDGIASNRDDPVRVKSSSDLPGDLRNPDGDAEVRCHGHADHGENSQELGVHDERCTVEDGWLVRR